MVLEDPDVKNSWVREFLPDKDLKKIQENENKQNYAIRLFNP